MKRKSLLILLLLAAFAPWTTAQETLTVADGGNSNTNIPFQSYYQDYAQRCDYIIPSDMLTDLDGATISSITLYPSYSLTVNNASVFLKEVENSTISTSFTGETGVQVFSGTLTLATTGMVITFTEGYVYNGGNLLVGIYKDSGGSYPTGSFSGQTTTTMQALYSYNWSATSWSQITTGTSYAFIPKTTFTYEPAQEGDCDKPETLVAEALSSETATLNWGGGSGTYNVEIKGGSYADWSLLLSNTTEMTTMVENLTPNTAYQVRVQSVCTGETPTSGYKTADFTTPMCDDMCSITLELTDSYGDGWSGNAIKVVNAVTGEVLGQFTNLNLNGTTGSGTNELNTHILPICPGLNIRFEWVSGTAYNTYPDECSWVVKDFNGEEIFSGSDATGYTTGQILATWTSSCAVPDCPNSTNLNAQVTGDQAELSWTSTATAWQVCLNGDEDNLIDITENPYTLESLTLSTNYTVKVRANCTATGDGYGDWSNTVEFTTNTCTFSEMCEINYEFTMGSWSSWYGAAIKVVDVATSNVLATWTGGESGSLLLCPGQQIRFEWQAGSYDTNSGVIGSYTITDINGEVILSGSGSPLAASVVHTVSCTMPTCLKPTMNNMATNIEATSATVSWTAGGTNQDHWDVYYSTTNTAPTASTVPQIAYTTDNPCTLTGLSASTTYYVWVRGNCGTEEEPDYSDWSAAYCTFTTTEYCADLKVDYYTIEFTDYTSSGVTVSWTAAGDATQWRVQVFDLQTSPYELKDEQVVTAPTATIDGLQSQLGYQVDIAPYCAEADDYTPTVSKDFSTLDDCPSPTDLAANDVTASSASISWTNNGLTEFNLRYSCDNTVTWIDKPNVTSPCTIDELPANTKIYVQVQGTCDATNDRWEEMTFFTSCGAFTVDADNDFFESFDTNFPDCWSNPSEYINNYNRQWARSTNQNHTTTSGSGSAYSGYYGPIYMMLPELAIADYKTDVKLTFWSYNTHTGDYTSAKQARNSVVLIDGTNETELWYAESVSSSWEESPAIDLSAYKGETIRLAFKYEGSNAHGWYVDDVKVAFDPTCMPVGTLAEATEVKATSAKLSWTLTDDTQDQWHVGYSTTQGGPYQIVVANTNDGFLLEDLTSETPYYVIVRAYCGDEDGFGEWSNEITFTTMEGCFTPYDIVASNITAVSADLTWTGESDSYNIEYWEKAEPNVILEEGFEGSTSMPSGWDNSIHDNLAYYWNIGAGSGYSNSPVSTAANGSNYNANYFNSTAGEAAWLISPAVNLEGFTQATLTFNYVNPGWYGGRYNLKVYYRIGEGGWQQLESYTEEQNSWIEKSITLTEDLAANYQIGFYVTGYNNDYGYGVGIDDVKISTPAVPGEVQYATSETDALTLQGLEAGKTYEVKVQGVCGGTEGEWSLVSEFTTLENGTKVFVAEGNWNEGANWAPAGAPALTDDVIIRANATIPSSCVALADEITIEGENTITIEDGGQLLHSTVAVYATMKKVVEPYEEAEGIDNYILLASPMQPTVFAEAVENLLPLWYENAPATFNVDFYQFDNSQELEWVNLENIDEFPLANGEGYLYAHNWESPITLAFKDALMYSHEPKAISLDYNSGNANWAGWNLIGNPFPCNATVSNAADPAATFNYYKINAAGEFVTADGTVAPMEGIFALATEAGQEATFTRVVPGENSIAPTDGILNVNLMSNEAATRKGNSRIDMARLRFGHGNNLGKLNLFGSNATVFFPQDGKDYSVMYAEAQGEMPLHFKTEKNGTYTLGFSTEDVSFGYLHLIDNLTGNDVDLLATPSYTFDARTTDYASRFRLVFSANGTNGDDNFGFIDAAGNLVITDATAGATLQIIDVMGRVVVSRDASNASAISTSGMTAGVYMLRLINGTNVKTQKIVVK